ncbi:hypothetical protein CYLTODRAFT_57222 [Cylindrobasidium torrendii FP15055 ss-10]|uniref:Uncharacterized protein n=1 Tax=Cylindrobasidium torrendii FP15055 ss-10 TaxID=1314674 RepID=A0A0D7B579_9AGAR|nr:hypothetical protein CYLTODRAFT_57222 [Cylindrobasidium torrendii FP15055 ss-10]
MSSMPSSLPQAADMSWEGDKMFNIYIYDYCVKRGFKNTARELQMEADLFPETPPPINARQGLLFEWWSVFWVLFTAKANSTGSDEALLYTQNMNQKRNAPPTQPGLPSQPHIQQRPMNGLPQPGRPFANGNAPPPPQNNGPQGPPGAPPFNMAPNNMNGGPGPLQQQPPPNGNFRPPQQQRPGPPFQSPTLSQQQRPHQPGSMLPPGQQGGPGYPQPLGGRPPSRTGTPGQSMMPPQGMVQGMNPHIQSIETEFRNISPQVLNTLRQEVGLDNKDISMYTMDDKQRVVSQYRSRVSHSHPRGPPNMNHNKPGAPPGPPMMHANPNQRTMGGPLLLQPPNGPPGQQSRPGKRGSLSPEETPGEPRNDSSPPDRKRPRRSPMMVDGLPGQPPMQQGSLPMYPSQPGGGPMGTNPMLRPGPGPYMNGGPSGAPGGPPGAPGFQNHGMMPNMGNVGSPAMGALAGQSGMMGAPMGQMGGNMPNRQDTTSVSQYRQSLSALHRQHLPQGAPGQSPSASGDSHPQNFSAPFNPPRPPGQPGPSKMPPPPSPSMKDQGKDGKADGSPHSVTAPPTPAPNLPGSGQLSNPVPSGSVAPSPGSMMQQGAPAPPASAPPSMGDTTLFATPDFMQTVANSLDDFGPPDLTLGGDINFERDFGQWFNHPDDNTASLDFGPK